MRFSFFILSLFATFTILATEINVTYPRDPFSLQLIVMRKKGLLQKEFAKDGIKVKFHDITNGLKQAKAAATGKIDICGSINTSSIIVAAGQGIKLNIIRAVCNSTNTWGLMTTNPNIKSVKDLKGKTIASVKGGNFQQFVLGALAKNNMTVKDVNYIPMSNAETYDALFAGKVDAGVLSTNKMLDAKKRGGRVLITASELMRANLVAAATESFAKEHPDWVGKYVKVQNEAMEFIKNHKHEALQLAAEDLGISYQDAEWLYNNTKLINTLSKDDIMSLKDDIDFLFEQKIIPKRVDILSQGAAIDIIFEDFVRDQISICAVSSRNILEAFHCSRAKRLRHN